VGGAQSLISYYTGEDHGVPAKAPTRAVDGRVGFANNRRPSALLRLSALLDDDQFEAFVESLDKTVLARRDGAARFGFLGSTFAMLVGYLEGIDVEQGLV
jgi:hypothetical protein